MTLPQTPPSLTVKNTELRCGMEITALYTDSTLKITQPVYQNVAQPGTLVVETEFGVMLLPINGHSTIVDDQRPVNPVTYHHLLVVNDGALEINELFTTERAAAERLHEAFKNDEFDLGLEEYEDAIEEADTDAAQGDHMEGVTPRIPGHPEEYLGTLRDLLSSNDYDVYLDTIYAPSNDGVCNV